MRLGYICKYTPIELLTASGLELIPLSPTAPSFPTAEALMHPNICSFAKAVLETASEAFSGEDALDGMILTTCCDSIRRLHDALCREFPDRFFFLLDIPRVANDFAASLYAEQIRELYRSLSDFSGADLNLPEEAHSVSEELPSREQSVTVSIEASSDYRSAAPEETLSEHRSTGPHIGIMGARTDSSLLRTIRDSGAEILFDLTCTGITRNLGFTGDLQDYSFRILNQIPCMRMLDASNRSTLLDGYLDRLDGILYHTVKFCDNFSFEYADFKSRLKVPLLQIETDHTQGSSGQIRTRVEAFLEELSGDKGLPLPRIRRKESAMYVLGIDSGSTSTNTVLLDQNREIAAYHVVRTGAKSLESAQRILTETLEKAGISREEVGCIVSTGYGRVSIPFADENVTEISCHGKGAHFLNPEVRTILDIGGQDSKAIRINEKGDVTDFVMNDKCAAGTGRFLEAMARTLEISVDDLGPISMHSREKVEISSMCTVFAESEVISLIALNKETGDIAAGVHRAIASKAMGLLRKVGLLEGFMMTGGVAKNCGVVAALEELLKSKPYIYKEPEIVGALGAALAAYDHYFS